MSLPTLPHGCNSYAAINRKTGKCIAELFQTDRRLPHFNFDKYKLVPMSDYLASLNSGLDLSDKMSEVE